MVVSRFFLKVLVHLLLQNKVYLSLSTANSPAPIAPQNSGLSDIKIFVLFNFDYSIAIYEKQSVFTSLTASAKLISLLSQRLSNLKMLYK